MSLDDLTAGGLVWLLTYALHSTLWLLAAWWITSRLAEGSERLQECLWKVALLGGVITASLQVASAVSPLGGQLVVALAAPVEPAQAEPAVPTAAKILTSHDVDAEDDQRSEDNDAAVLPVPQITNPTAQSPITPASPRWSNWLLLAWLAAGGIGALLLTAAVVRLAFRWGLAAKEMTAGPLFDALLELRQTAGIRRRVRLLTSARICGPLAMGLVRPQICVPQRALEELSPAEQRAMLAHELAHVARHDPAWLVLCRLLEVVFCFQPLNRLARRRIQESAELLCDAWAVEQTGGNVSLARCLTEVAEWIVAARQPLAAVAMATPGSGLGRRVRRLLENRIPARPLPRIALVLLVALIPLAAWGLPGVSAQRSADRPPPPRERDAPRDLDRRRPPRRDFDERAFPAPFDREFVPPPSPEVELAQLDRELAELEAELQALREDIEQIPELAAEVGGMVDRLVEQARHLRARRDGLWRAHVAFRENEPSPRPLSQEPPR